MDTGDFAFAIERQVKRFNGKLFKGAKALPLERHEIGELAAAAKYNWKEVEPAIFGTLLEQALDPKERARLGAHYTPRSYVERLVVVTVMEPLRQEWAQVQATAERLKEEQRTKQAIGVVRAFHDKLCTTRVLDPACGTGNFLYVSTELKINEKTAYKLAADGEIPCFKVGGSGRFERKELANWIKRKVEEQQRRRELDH
jgi:excisionase family DNA binding protein